MGYREPEAQDGIGRAGAADEAEANGRKDAGSGRSFRGHERADWAWMLLRQGALAFELFNGVKSPIDAMRDALYARLGRGA